MSFYKYMINKMKGSMLRILPMLATCEELEEFIGDYTDGTLPDKQRQKFELHLRLCVSCTRYMQNYQKAIALSQTSFEDSDPPDCDAMPESLVQAILSARSEPP